MTGFYFSYCYLWGLSFLVQVFGLSLEMGPGFTVESLRAVGVKQGLSQGYPLNTED